MPDMLWEDSTLRRDGGELGGQCSMRVYRLSRLSSTSEGIQLGDVESEENGKDMWRETIEAGDIARVYCCYLSNS